LQKKLARIYSKKSKNTEIFKADHGPQRVNNENVHFLCVCVFFSFSKFILIIVFVQLKVFNDDIRTALESWCTRTFNINGLVLSSRFFSSARHAQTILELKAERRARE
jgi:hypothetical protein